MRPFYPGGRHKKLGLVHEPPQGPLHGRSAGARRSQGFLYGSGVGDHGFGGFPLFSSHLAQIKKRPPPSVPVPSPPDRHVLFLFPPLPRGAAVFLFRCPSARFKIFSPFLSPPLRRSRRFLNPSQFLTRKNIGPRATAAFYCFSKILRNARVPVRRRVLAGAAEEVDHAPGTRPGFVRPFRLPGHAVP